MRFCSIYFNSPNGLLGLWDYLLDFGRIFFPRYCPACLELLVKGEPICCLSCELQLPFTTYHLGGENEVVQLFEGRAAIEGASALFYFNRKGLIRDLLHAIKYDGQASLARRLGRIHAKSLLAEEMPALDCIIPIPMHPSKRRSRGFNQSEVYAEGLAEVLALPVQLDCLIRVKKGATQTGKNRFQRWEAVQTLYRLKQNSGLAGKSVLLVDDVITTGVTLEYCAECLNKEGARVYLAAIAFGERI